MASRNNRAAEDILDAQNQEYHERLSSKASYLKSIAFDMEMEAKDHHRLLNGVDDDFDSTSSLLGGTINRLGIMISSGRSNRRVMMYISVAVVGFIFLLYLILGKLTSSSESL